MKKVITFIISSLFITAIITGCKKDSNNPNDLSGTSWLRTGTTGTGLPFKETLSFTSASTYTDAVVVTGTSSGSTINGTYTCTFPNLVVSANGSSQNGVIKGNELDIYFYGTSGGAAVYTKQ